MQLRHHTITGLALMMLASAGPAAAQYGNGGISRNGGSGVSTRDAVNAAILSDVSRDRQADRDAKQTPYATPGYGPIGSAKAARDACARDALDEAGPSSKLAGVPRASTMSTGWEVEGWIKQGDARLSFVCSVRNGSVSGVTLR
ncbi:hypothetical protein BH10PSE12_BH10PSE12_30920 [soil metagenome]